MNKYSQVKAFSAIFKGSVRATLKNPSALVFGFVFPLIFILIFGFIGEGGQKINIAITDDSYRDNPLYASLKKNDSVNLIENYDGLKIQDELIRGNIDAKLQIDLVQMLSCPSGRNTVSYCNQLDVNLTTTSASTNSPLATSIINGISNGINLDYLNLYNLEGRDLVELNTNQIEGREFKTIDFILPGQLGFALLSTGIFGTAFVFVNLRQTLVLKRFFATPIRRLNIIFGEALSRIIVSSIQTSTLILFGVFFLDYTLVNGIFTFLQMLVLIFLGLVVFMGVGFVISGVAKDERNVPPLANLFTLPQFLLSGTFFTIDAFPEWLEKIANVLPLTYLNDAMRKIAFEGQNLFEVWNQILILLIWGIVIYVLAIKTFKWE